MSLGLVEQTAPLISPTGGESSTADPIDSQDDIQTTFELIRRVGNRIYLYDSENTSYKNRNITTRGWDEVAADLTLKGRSLTGKSAKTKWRALKIYFAKVKRDGKGRSGDGQSSQKPWMYFKAIDNIMRNVATENEETVSNLDDVLSSNEPAPGVTSESADRSDDLFTTLKTGGNNRSEMLKRSRKCEDDDRTELINLLKASGKEEDEYFHFGMSVAEKLRNWSSKKSSRKQRKIALILYNSDSSDDE